MSWDNVAVRVIVREGSFVGQGEVLYEEDAASVDYDITANVSLDDAYAVAKRFPTERIGIHEGLGYQVQVSGRDFNQGATNETILIVLEAVDALKKVAWHGVAAMFAEYLRRELRDDEH